MGRRSNCEDVGRGGSARPGVWAEQRGTAEEKAEVGSCWASGARVRG